MALQNRAARIARDCGAPRATPIHLLLALTREPGTAAARCIAAAGCDVKALHTAVVGALVSRRPAVPRRISTRARERVLPTPPAGTPSTPRNPPRLVTTAPSTPHRATTRTPQRPRRPAAPQRARVAPPRLQPSPVSAAKPERPLLDTRRLPWLATLGRDLTAAAARGDLDPLVGRAKEVEQVLDVLHRRHGACPCLVGPSGVGKTAIVHGLAQKMSDGTAGEALAGHLLVEVPASEILAGTGARGSLSERLAGLRKEVARAEGRILLFLDDLHAILGPEAAAEVGAELRSAISRGEMSCIAATSPVEYRRTIEADPALERRFSRVDVEELPPADALEVLGGLRERYAAYHGIRIDDGALEAAVKLSVRYLPARQLPDKAISVLDLASARTRRRGHEVVDGAAVAGVVATLSGAPEERIRGSDASSLLDLEARLAERIVGHTEPLHRIASALRRNAAGFRHRRPIGSFLLLGPTGVGKTETARALADVLFPEGGAMTRLDLGEYAEAHTLARLVGAPPGYVGHEEGGQLTEAVRRRPYQLLLFDELEKAHVQVLLALLGLLEDGRLTDGRGRTVDFTNTVLVLTSNLGIDARASGEIGFGAAGSETDRLAESTFAAARRVLPPELWNRIDETLFYTPLARTEVAEIARRMLAGTARALEDEHDVTLTFDEDAIDALIDAGGWDPSLGARPMRRTIQSRVEGPLAELVLSGEVARGATVRLEGTLGITPLPSAR